MKRFELDTIEAGLNTYFIGKAGKNELFEEIGSTSDRAIELANSGAAEGIVVLARMQSSGRGRQGRAWVSPKDSGIFMSVILRPTLDQTLLPLISLATGVAVCQAIEIVSGTKIGLKWVNDIVHEGKKIGGILAEMPGAQSEQRAQGNTILPPAVIVGLGLNLCVPLSTLPDDLKGQAANLDEVCGSPLDANQLIAELCNCLEEQYNHLRHGFHELVVSGWRNYSQTLGKRIKATIGNETLEGTAEDIAEFGALILRLDNGEKRELPAGEIRIRLEDGSYA